MSFNELYSLGGKLEAQGRYDEAFAAFSEANQLQRDAREAARAEAEEIGGLNDVLQTWSPEFIARYAGHGERSKAPIFVVGMPRSGTSLIEHILAAHPHVTGLGEIEVLHTVVADQFPMNPKAEFRAGHFKRMGGRYLHGAQQAGWKSAGRFVDKQISNRWLLGPARLMFPNATIIHAVRDPMDTCLSNFLVQFHSGLPLANDLADIGRQYVRYRTLVDYWTRVLPGQIIHVNHEGMVEDPEGSVRALVKAVGLVWDDRCLRFFESQREVKTASANQVNRPIFGDTVGRWRRYQKHLGPLIEALGAYVSEVRT
jgi:hypothetical protein